KAEFEHDQEDVYRTCAETAAGRSRTSRQRICEMALRETQDTVSTSVVEVKFYGSPATDIPPLGNVSALRKASQHRRGVVCEAQGVQGFSQGGSCANRRVALG